MKKLVDRMYDNRGLLNIMSYLKIDLNMVERKKYIDYI